MQKVFISYQRPDHSHAYDLGTQVAKDGTALQYEHHKVDEDKRSQGDTAVMRYLRSKIERCAAVVLVLGPSTSASRWVDYELAVAQSFAKPIQVVQVPNAGRPPPLPEPLAKATRVLTWKQGVEWLRRFG